jgi:hypothetical protein
METIQGEDGGAEGILGGAPLGLLVLEGLLLAEGGAIPPSLRKSWRPVCVPAPRVVIPVRTNFLPVELLFVRTAGRDPCPPPQKYAVVRITSTAVHRRKLCYQRHYHDSL